jgi:hypothetical protein
VLIELEHAKLNIVVDWYSSTHAKRISAVERPDLHELQESMPDYRERRGVE